MKGVKANITEMITHKKGKSNFEKILQVSSGSSGNFGLMNKP